MVDVVDLGRDDGVVEAAFASWTARSTPRTPGGRAGQDVEIATVPPTVVQRSNREGFRSVRPVSRTNRARELPIPHDIARRTDRQETALSACR